MDDSLSTREIIFSQMWPIMFFECTPKKKTVNLFILNHPISKQQKSCRPTGKKWFVKKELTKGQHRKRSGEKNSKTKKKMQRKN